MAEVLYDSPYEVLDPRFGALINPGAKLERLATGFRWAEGPAYFPGGRYLVWSDIPNNRMMRWNEADGHVSEFRAPSNNTNGHTIDRQGRLVSCEHLARRVTRTEHDGSITVIADAYQGNRLNSPNDVVVRSDGSIWFTDPSYGIDTDYEGARADREQDGCHVYRVDPDSGNVTRVADDFERPNGLAFSIDESKLYVSDSGRSHGEELPHHMRVFDVVDGKTLRGGEVFAVCEPGFFDGFRLDERGNIWSSAGDGVQCFAPDGTLIGKLKLPEGCANVVFGMQRRDRLFMTATTSVYAIYLLVRGHKTF
jgi:gluconolactonase